MKPIDREAVVASAKKTGAVVTAENHNIIGGLRSAVAEVLVEECPVPLRAVGVKDVFGQSRQTAIPERGVSDACGRHCRRSQESIRTEKVKQ